jgi:hypothetical protein
MVAALGNLLISKIHSQITRGFYGLLDSSHPHHYRQSLFLTPPSLLSKEKGRYRSARY